MLDKAEFLTLDIVRHSIAGVANIVATIDSHPFSATIPLLEGDIPDDSGSIFFGT